MLCPHISTPYLLWSIMKPLYLRDQHFVIILHLIAGLSWHCNYCHCGLVFAFNGSSKFLVKTCLGRSKPTSFLVKKFMTQFHLKGIAVV